MVSLAGSLASRRDFGCPLKRRTRVMRVASHEGYRRHPQIHGAKSHAAHVRYASATCMHNECAKSRLAHEYSPMIGRVIERLKTARCGPTLVDFDARIARSVALDQSEQCRRMRGMQPDAAVRGGSAEPREVVGAVNGEAVIEEDRVRHRRVVIFAGEIMPRHRLRMEYAARRAIAAAAGRDRPVVARRAVNADRHALG